VEDAPEREFFHEGMRAFQDQFDGRRVADALEKHRKHYAFWADEEELITSAPFFFIASTFGEFVDCSIKSGDPGFVRLTGPGTIEYPEYDGNSMYRTLGNIARNPNVGLLFVRFDGRSRRIRINGRARVILDADRVASHIGAKAVISIECEIYPNCPRYLPDLAAGKVSPHVPRAGQGVPPPPEWKHREDMRAILPQGDAHIPIVNPDPDKNQQR